MPRWFESSSHHDWPSSWRLFYYRAPSAVAGRSHAWSIDDAFAFRPAMKGAISKVKLAHPGDEGFNERVYADTSYWNGVMRCSDVWFADSRALAAQYAYDLSRGFHVRNTTPRSITAHETAHAIEYIVYLKTTNQKNDAAAVHAFSGLAESNVIVNPTARRYWLSIIAGLKTWLRKSVYMLDTRGSYTKQLPKPTSMPSIMENRRAR